MQTRFRDCLAVLILFVVVSSVVSSAAVSFPAEITVSASAAPNTTEYSSFGPSSSLYGNMAHFGMFVNNVGDLNGDGFEDFAFSVPDATPSGTSLSSAGAVFVIWGKLSWSTASDWPSISSFPNSSLGLLINGIATSQQLGLAAMSGDCDLNHDNIDDLILGSNGAVYVIYGRTSNWPGTFDLTTLGVSSAEGFKVVSSGTADGWSTTFGLSAKCVSDMNGDNHNDLLVGDYLADSGNARVALIFGASSSWPTTINVTYPVFSGGVIFQMNETTTDWDTLGFQLATADLNADGHLDIIIGSPNSLETRGYVHVIWGGGASASSLLQSGATVTLPYTTNSSLAVSLHGPTYQSLWGIALSSGDVNGDSYADLVLRDFHNRQVTIVFSQDMTAWSTSPLTSPMANLVTVTNTAESTFGAALASGDINGDEFDDVFIGCFASRRVYIVFGKPTASWTADLTVQEASIDGVVVSLISGNGSFAHTVGVVHGVSGAVDQLLVGAPEQNTFGVGYLVAGSICKTTAADDKCTQCFVGYGLDSVAGTCTACVSGQTFSNGTTPCQTSDIATLCSSYTQAGTCSSCVVGYGLEFGECLECRGNTWSSGNTPCLTGPTDCTTINHETGHCLVCPVGHGTYDCLVCTGNTWSNGTTDCKPVTDFNCKTAVHTSDSCETCENGFKVSAGACVACTGNTFSDDGLSCKTGPTDCGVINHETGQCIACLSGFELNTIHNNCTACSGNTWSSGTTCLTGPTDCATINHENGVCLACPAGYGLNANECTVCIGTANKWSNGTTDCLTGPINCLTVNHETGSCEKCEVGMQVSSGVCMTCTGNTFSDDGIKCVNGPTDCKTINHATSNCTACSIGFGINTMSNNCTQCTGNTFSDGTTECQTTSGECVTSNHTTGKCLQCVAGFSVTETGICWPCTGTTFSSDGIECSACNNHSATCNHTTGKALECEGGFSIDTAAGTCTECVGNTWRNDIMIACETSLVGNCSTANHTTGSCISCLTGFALANQKCVACTNNTFSDDGLVCQNGPTLCQTINHQTGECSKCPGGFSLIGNRCTECMGNTWSAGTSLCNGCGLTEPCSSCDHSTGECNQCPPGNEPDLKTCNECIGNTWSNGAINCRVGNDTNCKTADHTTGSCKVCNDGFEVTTAGTCTACEGTTFSNDGLSCYNGPRDCAVVNHQTGICEACSAGFGLDTVSNNCSACVGNTWGNGTTECLPGTNDTNCVATNHTTGKCARCLSGFQVSSDDCVACSGNTVSIDGMKCVSGPTNCESVNHENGTCYSCVVGAVLSSSANTCTACTGNTWSNNGTQSECEVGPVGSCRTANHTTGSCVSCLAGFSLASQQCTACTGNTFSTTGIACSAGPSNCKTVNHETGQCSSCESGYIASNSGLACTLVSANAGNDSDEISGGVIAAIVVVCAVLLVLVVVLIVLVRVIDHKKNTNSKKKPISKAPPAPATELDLLPIVDASPRV